MIRSWSPARLASSSEARRSGSHDSSSVSQVGRIGARQLLGRPLDEVVEPPVTLATRATELGRVESLERELAHRAEHHESRARAAVGPSQQRRRHERLEILDARAEPHVRRGRREPPLEHREARMERAVLGGEDRVAPGQRRRKRSLALRQIMGRGGAEPDLHLRREVVHRQQPRAGGRDLDREREAVETAAQLAQHRLVGGVEPEPAVRGPRALDEQLDGGVLVERVDDDHALVGEMERRTTRTEHDEAIGALHEVGDERRGPGHVLEVVQDEQQLAVGEVVEQRLLDVPLLLDLERSRDLGHDELRGVDRGEPHEVDPVRELAHQRARGLDREARLACAPGPHQRHQPRAGAKQLAELSECLDPSDGRPPEDGQVRRGGGAQRRERRVRVGADELEEALVTDVAQPVTTEVDEGEARLLARERARDAREHDLAAVGGRADPCAPVDVQPDVPSVAQLRLTGVDPHPHPQLGVARPDGRGECALCVSSGVERAVGAPERDEERVALGVDLDAAVARATTSRITGPVQPPARPPYATVPSA